MRDGRATTLWARAFLEELVRAGVSDLCIAPGSRSTPLVLAAAREGRLRLHSILDERSAGFFALGLSKALGRPAAVLTTSGTAAANLYPSVIEASWGEIPLLVLTADRPHHLRDSDANQAMDQLHLYGGYVRAFFEVAPPVLEDDALLHLRSLAGRAVAAAQGPPPGPVHLNFPLAKPLEPPPEEELAAAAAGLSKHAAEGRPDGGAFVRVRAGRPLLPAADMAWLEERLKGAGRGLIVAGPTPGTEEIGPAVLTLGAATGFPVLADPLSGARFRGGAEALVLGAYDLFLRSAELAQALRPDLVLRVGRSPTSATLLAYLDRHRDAYQVVLDEGYRWKDHPASAHAYLKAAPGPTLEELANRVPPVAEEGWREAWATAEAVTAQLLSGAEASSTGGALLEGAVLAAVASEVPEGGGLFVSSSMPVRDLDAFARPRRATLRLYANRGVSGIDGVVSTAAGIALGRQDASSTPMVAVLGDLAFLHDAGGLRLLRAFRPPLVLVVINNDGGGIFHTLPVRGREPEFTRFFATPHGLDLGGLASAHGLSLLSVRSLSAFRAALREALLTGEPGIIEVLTDREATHARREQVVREIVDSMTALVAGGPTGPDASQAVPRGARTDSMTTNPEDREDAAP